MNHRRNEELVLLSRRKNKNEKDAGYLSHCGLAADANRGVWPRRDQLELEPRWRTPLGLYNNSQPAI